jgi:CheY-like chemotaxis protein
MSKTNILIVEDESIVAKHIQHSLKKLGYFVVGICSSGEDAIKTAEDVKPDLILMDIMLKGDMSGIEAAAQIREKFNIPIKVIEKACNGTDRTIEEALHKMRTFYKNVEVL